MRVQIEMDVLPGDSARQDQYVLRIKDGPVFFNHYHQEIDRAVAEFLSEVLDAETKRMGGLMKRLKR